MIIVLDGLEVRVPPVPPDDELSDEVPVSDEAYEGDDAGSEAVEYASDGSDVPIADGAPDDSDPYQYQDYQGPQEDLSQQLADDAGERASYGFDAASETARFSQRPDLAGLKDAASASDSDDSDKYKMSDSSVGEAPAFAEAAPPAGEEPSYEPPAEALTDESDPGLASHVPEDESGYTGEAPSYAEEGAEEAQAGFTVEDDDAGGHVAFGDAPATEEEAPVAEAEPEPEPAPPKATGKRAAPPPVPAAPAPTGDDNRPGQVRKSAIDEMFARAAELKRRKP
jgi:hypothetical protein